MQGNIFNFIALVSKAMLRGGLHRQFHLKAPSLLRYNYRKRVLQQNEGVADPASAAAIAAAA
jgi:hypothetical protein